MLCLRPCAARLEDTWGPRLMTLNALILAVAATIVGSVFTLYTAARISRENGRTAARLVYSELIRNSASIAYYLRIGTWPQVQLDAPVWNQHGEAIAKIRKVGAFNTIYKGYAALEALAFLAKEGADLGEERERILREEVRALCDAIRMAGITARVGEREIAANLAPFDTEHRLGAERAAAPFTLHSSAPFIPTAILRHIADSGTTLQRESAQHTIEASPMTTSNQATAPHAPSLRRLVYDAQGAEWEIPKTVARREGDAPTGDPAVDEVYDAMGTVHRFFWNVYGLDLQIYTGSMVAVVHFGDPFDNMFWDGAKLVVGNPSSVFFNNSLSAALDAVGHELFHIVTQFETKLQFLNQAGSLMEATADVFGSLVMQHHIGQRANEASWLIGEGLLVSGRAIRSLAEPGSAFEDDRQVFHMKNFVRTTDDHGGVHANAGIPAHAFYRMANALGGYAWDPAGRIWLSAVRDKRLRSAGFSTFAGCTVMAARQLYGDDSVELTAVAESWQAVGVRIPKNALHPAS